MSSQEIPSDTEKTTIEALSYEQAFAELESIVSGLESEKRSLEDAIDLFERGQALARHCADLLEKAELRVQQLSGEELVDFSPQT